MPAAALDYVVEIDEAAQQLDIRARFDQPIRVAMGSQRASRHVRKLRRCDSDESLVLRRGSIQSSESCIQYSVRLNKSANDRRTRERYAAVRDIVTSPDNWMMLPNDSNSVIDVVFVLPRGVNVSVPWRPSSNFAFAQSYLAELTAKPGTQTRSAGQGDTENSRAAGSAVKEKAIQNRGIRDSTAKKQDARRTTVAAKDGTGRRLEGYSFRHREISSDAITAFGKFEKHNVAVPGGELRVALLRTKHKTASDKMQRWLSDAAYNVSQAHGKFPLQSTQVVVVPVNDRAAEPVPFGRVVRNGGEAVQFFVDTDWSLDSFLGDWTATHEFSHLLMPYVEDRYVSEGFASYYQNVLMARGKVYSAKTAWRKLHEGYGRGRMSAPGMSPRSATMRNGGLMKIYWSGAALAFMGDVELRQLTGNRESLDSAMSKIRLCCLPSRKAYNDLEFFKLLDSKTGHTVFADLHREYANSGGFPEVSDLFKRMGIETGSDVLLVDAELSDIRDAIMRPRGSEASSFETEIPADPAARADSQ